MALPLRSNSPRGSVGLDLDGSYVAAVRAENGRIHAAASAELPDGLVANGEVLDAHALGDVLKGFFKTHDLPKRVRLGVSNQQIVVRHLELPMIKSEQELAAAVRFQAAEAIAMPLDQVVLDYQVTGESTSPDGSPRLKVVVVAARETMIDNFVSSVRGAGLKPEGVDLNAFALVRTLHAEGGDEEGARVYCHLGGVTNLAIAVGSNCLFTRLLSTSWEDEGEQTPAAIADEIRLSIDFYMAQPDARSAEEVLLSGPGVERPGLVEELDRLIHVPVSVPNPLGPLPAEGLPNGEDPHRHTVAVGLALGAAA
jgi:type IV pilus assembly protein PilM